MSRRLSDNALMARALQLALHGPPADPNPRVGAVIADADGQVVGHGFHDGAGTQHAEIMALAQAGPQAAGGTAYVTLEPCNHRGRTGPCSEALLAAKVASVVFAQADPNPQAAGGAAGLKAAGVTVEGGLLAEEARTINQAWTFAVQHGRPRVVWKFAATLDGRSAAADGTSKWITGPDARSDVHRLRSESGAILVGTGTILADDPALTVRAAVGSPRERQPLRVILGERPIPGAARVLTDSSPTLHLTHRDPVRALQELADRQIRQVFLEGGPTLAAAFLSAGLVDEVVAYLAPVLLGSGASAVGDLNISTLADAVRLTPVEITSLGPDIRVRATLDTTTRKVS